jgi:signal transduction histidine kinase
MILLLFIAMFLINVVIVLTHHRHLLRAEIDRTDLILTALEKSVWDDSESVNKSIASRIGPLIRQSNLVCTAVLNKIGDPIFYGGPECHVKEKLNAGTLSAIQSGKREVNFFGQTWGIFWLQDQFMTVAKPRLRSGKATGAVGGTIKLDNLYRQERRSQKVFFIYIAINLAILTFIGVYRISKIYLEPLHRLSKRAEDYHEDSGEMVFAVRKEDNELHHLSKALNRMLSRIAEDKKKLQSTVNSLEKANIDLKKAQNEIIRAEKLASVGRLSAGIAHEIGNPIGIVMGYLDLLKQTDLADDDASEYIQRTEDELNRINTIIRQLLDLSRPSKEGVEPIQVHEVIQDITEVVKFQPLMSEITIDLLLDAPQDRVMADPNQLRQVFLNLMINAADAIASNRSTHDEKGRIAITSAVQPADGGPGQNGRSRQPMLTVEVSDNGPGIAEENLSNIFDPFFTTKEPGKGTGLGLSVSFMIIEGVGGRITAGGRNGEGTVMTLTLPLAEDADSASETNAAGVLSKDENR